MDEKIRKRLEQLADKKYRDFSAALSPGETRMLGVRLPELRKIAKELASDDFENYFKQTSDCFEEVLIHGMMIGYATAKDKSVDRALGYIDSYIDDVSGWSICDSTCNTLTVLRKEPERTWENIQKYIHSDKEFYVRTGYIITLFQLSKIDKEGKWGKRLRTVDLDDISCNNENKGLLTERIFESLNRNINEGYYAMMEAAWLIAEMFVVYPAATYEFLQYNELDNVTFNKAIQKICESLIPTREVKECVRKMKR